MTEVVPVLYILQRNDLASMNNGKGTAHGAHAAGAFAKWYYTANELPKNKPQPHEADAWHNATLQGFGTTITLAVNEYQMRTTVEFAKNFGFQAEIAHDPTYPIKDGDVVHLIPLDTCAYVFVPDKDDPRAKLILGRLPLHP